MRFLYRLFGSVLLSLLPLVVVLYSLVWSAGNPDVYRSAFVATDFYEKISTLAKNHSNLNHFQAKDGIPGLLLVLAFKDFSADQWKELVEGNIATFTEWLSGDDETLVLYIPTETLEKNLVANLDDHVRQIVQDSSSNLPECSPEETKNIKKQGGFAVDQALCLPKEVKSGQQSFTKFLEPDQNGILDRLLQNNYLSLRRNRYSLSDLRLSGPIQTFLTGPLNRVRDLLLIAKQWTWNVVVIVLASLGLYVALTWLARRSVSYELAFLFKAIGLSLLIWCGIIILSLGGAYYLNAAVLSLISPVFALGEVTSLILSVVVRIAFNLLLPALWAALGCFVLWVLFGRLYSRHRLRLQARNEQLINYQPDYTQASTFDGQFRQAVQQARGFLAQDSGQVQPHSNQTSQANCKPSSVSVDFDTTTRPTARATTTEFVDDPPATYLTDELAEDTAGQTAEVYPATTDRTANQDQVNSQTPTIGSKRYQIRAEMVPSESSVNFQSHFGQDSVTTNSDSPPRRVQL